jgi:predicted transcriptional regulator YdeE
MTILTDFVQTRICKMDDIALVGFTGEGLDQENALFDQLNVRSNEVANKKNEYEYMVIEGNPPTLVVAIEVTEIGVVPEGMISYTIPQGNYVVFSFEARFIGEFWEHVCSPENQARYNIDLSKPRFEIFTKELQAQKRIEWYIPVR